MANFSDFDSFSGNDRKKSRFGKKTILKKSGSAPAKSLSGWIVSALAKVFIVEYENTAGETEFCECSVGGAIYSPHEKASIAAVGDFVKFVIEKERGSSGISQGAIVAVEDRDKKLSRRAAGKDPYEHVIAANFDTLLIVAAAANPPYNKRLIDRLLVAAELGCMASAICINKTDLGDVSYLKNDFLIYNELNIPVFFVSAFDGSGFDEIEIFLKNTNSVVAGPSGVGKSTLLNRLLGGEIQKVNEISEKTFKGKHTTSYTRSFRLPGGGFIADTPGIREFSLWGVNKPELPLYFHDFDEYFPGCQFVSCTHIHEPVCAVIEALEAGKIDPERYESYLNMYDSLEE